MIIINSIKQSIVLKGKINKEDYCEIKNLEKICAERDKVSFKLELEYKLNILNKLDYEAINLNDFMFYDSETLIGYIGMNDFGGDTFEVNGMVHPDNRNKGIFTRLFSLVQDEWKKRLQQEMLLLCDNNSISGIEFIKKVTDDYDHSEYDMVLNMEAIPRLSCHNIILRNAKSCEAKRIAEMDSLLFDMDAKEDDELIKKNIENGTTFIAETNNTDIGKVRLEINDGVGGIYGLGVLPEFRGKGYGRELLLLSVDKLKEMGCVKIILQVEVNNRNALNLYKSCGFEENYVMDYYKMKK